MMDREVAEGEVVASPYSNPSFPSPFTDHDGYSKIGQEIIDERLTVVTDPVDPALGYPPFGPSGKDSDPWRVYRSATWIQDGILKELPYYHGYAVKMLGMNTGGFPFFGDKNAGAFHMKVNGEMVTIDEMIATTRRGILVTRMVGVSVVDYKSALVTGYTRDGTWLIENGKISKPIRNFRITESPLFVLNNIEQISTPQRIFSPGIPVVVPALKVRDFSFTSLTDAV
jgi:predicted Zn-dependent protease